MGLSIGSSVHFPGLAPFFVLCGSLVPLEVCSSKGALVSRHSMTSSLGICEPSHLRVLVCEQPPNGPQIKAVPTGDRCLPMLEPATCPLPHKRGLLVD